MTCSPARLFARLLTLTAFLAMSGRTPAAEVDFASDIRPFFANYCFDCHDADLLKGGLNLERFQDDAGVMADRPTWKTVFDRLEDRQMPPPKRKWQPSDEERATILSWIRGLLARPDPVLGVRDPGKPVLRRLNRLEYNNRVHDLLELPMDIFMLSERVPVRKDYFQPAAGRMPHQLAVRTIEYGGRFPSLLPGTGLPSDNRAAHGFNNRGDPRRRKPPLR